MEKFAIAVITAGVFAGFSAFSASDEVVAGDLGRQIDSYFTGLESEGFCGSLLVAKDGDVAIAKGYGMANRDEGIPVTPDTIFTVGSITKQFTAAAIMKLVAEGELAVTDPITKFFDDVPEDRHDITIHHLLTHTSGLRDIRKGDYDPVSRDAIVREALAMRGRLEPGEQYRYSNAGYSILGAIIEIVTGKGYEEYLRENLFIPAGMNDTGYQLPDWNEGQIAHGYLRNGDDWGTVIDRPWAEDGPYWVLRANGGIHSNIWDMYAWHKALLDDTVLPEDARKELFKPHVPENPEGTSHYGYGWAIFTTERDTKLIAHNGGNGVYFADFRWYVEDDVVIILMTSTAQLYENDAYHRDLRRIIFGFEPLLSPGNDEPAP